MIYKFVACKFFANPYGKQIVNVSDLSTISYNQPRNYLGLYSSKQNLSTFSLL